MYDYAPTPRGIYGAVEEALQKERDLLRPGEKELMENGKMVYNINMDIIHHKIVINQ